MTQGPREARLFLLYLAAFLLLWTVLPLLIGREPPNDNLEQLAWSDTFSWGYAKHPPLPTWELIAAGQLFRKSLGLTYTLGALQVALMLFFAYRFASSAMGAARARVAVLLITCILFYSHRMHFLNHNMLLLSAYSAAVWCAWRAIATPRAAWWVALGAAWGIGMLSKYQMVVGVAASLLFIACSQRRPWQERLRGTALAGAVAMTLLAPHAVWMLRDRFRTLGYATSWVDGNRSIVARLLDVAQFAAEQIGRLAPALLVLAVLVALSRRRRPHGDAVPLLAGDSDLMKPADVTAARALRLHAWGPLAAMAVLSLSIGLDLGMPWGTAFLWTLPLWALSGRVGARIAELRFGTVMAVVVAVQLGLIAAYR